MKQLTILLLLITLFSSCSKDDDDPELDKMNEYIIGSWSPVLTEEYFINKEFLLIPYYDIKRNKTGIRETRKYTTPINWTVTATKDHYNFEVGRWSSQDSEYYLYNSSQPDGSGNIKLTLNYLDKDSMVLQDVSYKKTRTYP